MTEFRLPSSGSPAERASDYVASTSAPATQVLSNGRYTTVVTAAGTGYSSYNETRLTRWIPDRTRDALGFFLYVADEDSGEVWSAGLQPMRRRPDRYTVAMPPGCIELRRRDGDVETSVDVCVDPDSDIELRRITLHNHGGTPRQLALTTYAEVVLTGALADAGHPAFSKLFVQTALTSDGRGLLAKRRLRGADENPLWLEHRLIRCEGSAAEPLEWETDRMRFIGRGRSLARPRAMDAGVALSGTLGDVLDPILSLRSRVTVGPRESVCFIATLAAAATAEATDAISSRFRALRGDTMKVVNASFEKANRRAAELYATLGIDETGDDEARQVALALGAALYGDASSPPLVAASDAVLDDRALLVAAQNAISAGRLRRFSIPTAAPGYAVTKASNRADQAESAIDTATRADREPLELFNGFGGFACDGTEFVIRMDSTPDGLRLPPQPWTNVIANERVGFIASETGAGYTWSGNSRTNRLTPWLNDPVCDPHGEAICLRDEDTRRFWSPTPGPVPGRGDYETRHGFGYTRYLHTGDGLREDVLSFVPRHDPVKLTRIRVTNDGTTTRRFSLFTFAHWVLGDVPWNGAGRVVSESDMGVIRASNADRGVFAASVAFAAIVPLSAHTGTVRSTTDRSAFLGTHGDLESPAALGEHALSNGAGDEPNSCAAFQLGFDIAPGDTFECVLLLGEGADDAETTAVLERYRDRNSVSAALDEIVAFWRDLVSGVQISTPSRAIDLMVNGWLTYQNLSCRIWGRSAFYQSGGAFGFRDQLQDTSALVYLAPDRTRDQIVLHASHQFAEGDVLHWWHPPASAGIRTHFSDDLLWLPYVAAFYTESTGDVTVLDEIAPFVDGPPVPAGKDEVFVHPELASGNATVYEHCCRAIDRSLTAGVHGLPLMGSGDWNDGMNRVGREGRGESVWLGFFLSDVLARFIPICERRNDGERVVKYRKYARELLVMLNDTGWDGDWYRRAYYDDGTPLGTASASECRIDAIAQAWSVIAAVASPERAARAIDAMETHLVSEREGIIRLLTPPFDRTPHDPGYIKGYLPGVRENGGQYTHAALWAVKALAELGRCERAAPLLEMLSPVSHSLTAEAVARYKVEPYVIAADVYGAAPHVGRGGWTWYTGSAGWMFRVALESVLGLQLFEGTRLVIRPCIPRAWPGFTVRYRLPDRLTEYEIVVTRADGNTTARIDGALPIGLDGGAIVVPLRLDAQPHRVEISLGDDIVPRFASTVATYGHSSSTAP